MFVLGKMRVRQYLSKLHRQLIDQAWHTKYSTMSLKHGIWGTGSEQIRTCDKEVSVGRRRRNAQ